VDDVGGYWRWFASLASAPDLSTVTTSPDMDEARPWQETNHDLDAALNRAAAHLLLFLLCRQYGRNTWAERALSALDGTMGLAEGDERIANLHALGLPDLATRRVVREARPGVVRRDPAPFADAVAWASLKWSIAPEWIWSIMRRESFFERTVRSAAGAIGLMQFMPKTAS
jgi:soluble lytic murein transglycosylase-like protein